MKIQHGLELPQLLKRSFVYPMGAVIVLGLPMSFAWAGECQLIEGIETGTTVSMNWIPSKYPELTVNGVKSTCHSVKINPNLPREVFGLKTYLAYICGSGIRIYGEKLNGDHSFLFTEIEIRQTDDDKPFQDQPALFACRV